MKTKSKIKKAVEKSDANYVERSITLRNEAVSAEVAMLNKLFEQIGGEAVKAKDGIIDGVNLMREAGLILQAWCGHEMMTFVFWKTNCEKKLKFNFETAKHFMSVARKLKKKAKTLAEAFEFTQLMLISEDLLELPVREELQIGAKLSPIQKLFNDFTAFRQQLKKATMLRPMEDWEPNGLEKFISETEWLALERDRAQQLLKEKK